MSIKPETIAQIQAMLEADPALLAQLQSAAGADSVAALLAAAAEAKGIAVSQTELAAHAQEAAALHAQMSDAELEAVAAGYNPVLNAILWVVVTTTALGLACAAVSAAEALLIKKDCKKAFGH